jgi:hypothetical protein
MKALQHRRDERQRRAEGGTKRSTPCGLRGAGARDFGAMKQPPQSKTVSKASVLPASAAYCDACVRMTAARQGLGVRQLSQMARAGVLSAADTSHGVCTGRWRWGCPSGGPHGPVSPCCALGKRSAQPSLSMAEASAGQARRGATKCAGAAPRHAARRETLRWAQENPSRFKG